MKKGTLLIEAERERQIIQEGYSLEHDLDNDSEELAIVGALYALPANLREGENYLLIDDFYPETWHKRHWKPTPDDRIKELVKAGALIAAEIDRLQQITK